MSWRRKLTKPKTGNDDGRPSLEELLEHYGVKHSSRAKQMVRCPIHGDNRTPSCSIDLDKQLWHCHSCGIGGDSWELIKRMEGVTYGGAVEFATDAGIAIDGPGPGTDEVRGSAFGGRRSGGVSARSGYHRGGGAYTPSWRRR